MSDEEQEERWQYWDACLHNARSAAEEGRHGDADDLFNKALAEAKQAGPESWRVAAVLYNIAYYGHLNQGRLEQAAGTFREALAIYEVAKGLPEAEKINEIQACLEGLAGISFKMQQLAMAVSYAQRLMSVSPELGSRNHAAAQMVNLVIRTCMQKGDWQQALLLCDSTLPIAETIYGATGHQLLRLLQLKAEILRKLERADEAAEIEARAESIKTIVQKNSGTYKRLTDA